MMADFLNFSMLKYFLQNPKNTDYSQAEISECFKGLRIMDNTELLQKHFCRYPVIELSFKKVKASNWDFTSAIRNLSSYLKKYYQKKVIVLID